jgi:hypothetical protein
VTPRAAGAARLLVTELAQAGGQIETLRHDRLLRRFDDTYAIELRPADLSLVATHLGGAAWARVHPAMQAIQALEAFVNTLVERGRRRLTRAEAASPSMTSRWCSTRWTL